MRITLSLGLFLVLLLGYSCDKNTEEPQNDLPSNLTIDLLSVDHETAAVVIQVTADNATRYEFFPGASESPALSNTDGFFEYQFESPGNYPYAVRAYGNSEKYIKAEGTVEIIAPEVEVPLDEGYFSSESYSGYQLIWQDEFNGSQIDDQKWGFDLGDGCPNLCGWGNNELQFYRRENAIVSGGTLIIEAKSQYFQNRNYTSAKLKTSDKFSFRYGRVDIRALLPKGQGLWPALWMLGDNINTVGWPASGEIDIMEMRGGGGRENQVLGTMHWDNNGHSYIGGAYTKSSGTFADAYHVFSIVWDETAIRWYVNNQEFYSADITPADMTEFHQNFWLIFNVAVGGNFGGDPDFTTIFPQKMKVDYVRVFQQAK